MGTRPKIVFENVRPKLDSDPQDIGLVEVVDFEIPDVINQKIVSQQYTVSTGKGSGDRWREFALNMSLGDWLSPADLENFNNLLKGIDEITRKLVIILKIIRLLSSDLKSITRFLKFALKQIVKVLKEFIDSFISTGFYMTLIVPDSDERDDTYMIPTWGDFDEFKKRIVAACLDIRDPGSPARLPISSQVGGFIIGGIAGTNNPAAIDTMLKNLQLLGNLFGFKSSFPSPPRNVMAKPGLYSSLGRDPKMGIKVCWSKPPSKGIVGYHVYRSKDSKGSALKNDDFLKAMADSGLSKSSKKKLEVMNSRVFDNEGFNGGKKKFVLANVASDEHSYVDYDIEEGVPYFYMVCSVIYGDGAMSKDPYTERIGGPLSSPIVSATARNCIPVSLIAQKIESLEGDLIDPQKYPSKWFSRSLRTYLGPMFDQMLDQVDQFADSLSGAVTTSSDAFNDYLDFMAAKISNYIRILKVVSDILSMILNFRLRGSLLLLELDAKDGGIEGFADRVSNSVVDTKGLGLSPTDNGKGLSSIQGYYFGMVTVYGIPSGNVAQYNKLLKPYDESYNATKKQLENSQRSIGMLLKLLTGKK